MTKKVTQVQRIFYPPRAVTNVPKLATARDDRSKVKNSSYLTLWVCA